MKRLMSIALFSIILIFMIAGCSSLNSSKKETVEGQVVKSDSAEEENEENKENEQEEESKAESQEINQLIADDENIKISLLKIVRRSGDTRRDEGIDIIFEIENKLDRNINLSAESVSSDGKMVDRGIYSMYQDITANKMADVELNIMKIDDKELPALEEDLELTIFAYDPDDYEFEELQYPVKISFE